MAIFAKAPHTITSLPSQATAQGAFAFFLAPHPSCTNKNTWPKLDVRYITQWFFPGTIYTDCSDDGSCTADDWMFVVKLGCLAAVLLTIFFVFTQCTRFAVHFSFCINTKGTCTCTRRMVVAWVGYCLEQRDSIEFRVPARLRGMAAVVVVEVAAAAVG